MREGDSKMLGVAPCGGTVRKPVHYTTNPGSKNVIGWTVIERAEEGNCTLKIASNPDLEDVSILYPLDGSADDNGAFPCGRDETPFEGKQVRFPKNMDCDACIFIIEWKTKKGIEQRCGYIQVSALEAYECTGLCLNGGVC